MDDTTLQIKKIDSLFAAWNTKQTPGYAVGIIRDGKLIFSKGYGMANLEYGVPITQQSPFYIGSMSKQFTAACAALLIQKGKLHLNDDVHQYLPELPDYGHPITIDQLIHHTSGIRDYSSMMLFAGQDRRFEHHYDKADVLRLIFRQKTIEFTPGAEYRYSNSGYILLTEIIERVTGKSLPNFAHENLFEPLGMRNTFYSDNYAAIIPGRVESYRRVDASRYERMLKHFDLYGDGGILTTIEDLALWDANFDNNHIGDKGFIDLLLTRGRLNSGEEIPYAFGLEFRRYKGHPDIEHNGFMLQFTADLVRFPEQRLSIIVLGNVADRFATQMAYQVADIYLENVAPEPPPSSKPFSIVPLTPDQQTGFTGYYWNGLGNFYRRVVLKEGQLILDWGEGTGGERLASVGSRKFVILDKENRPVEPMTFVTFESHDTRKMEMTVTSVGNQTVSRFNRYNPTPPLTPQELIPYAGEYYSEELETYYRFAVTGDTFTLRMDSGKPINLFPHPDGGIIWNAKDKLWTGFGEIIFQRNRKGRVTGLTIGDQRVSGVHFTKIH